MCCGWRCASLPPWRRAVQNRECCSLHPLAIACMMHLKDQYAGERSDPRFIHFLRTARAERPSTHDYNTRVAGSRKGSHHPHPSQIELEYLLPARNGRRRGRRAVRYGNDELYCFGLERNIARKS
jgi:hypothetical protein